MNINKSKLLTILIVLLALSPGRALAAQQQGQEQGSSVSAAWQMLKEGKAIVLMRHALAPGVGDPLEFDLDNCSTQRNLSDDGRDQARAVGDVFRANGVTGALVMSSQWCRCMETARLLDLGLPEPATMLNSFFQRRQLEDDQTRTLRESLDEWLSRAGNSRVLVTHQVNITSLTGQFAGSGDMLFVTMDSGKPVVLARISTD